MAVKIYYDQKASKHNIVVNTEGQTFVVFKCGDGWKKLIAYLAPCAIEALIEQLAGWLARRENRDVTFEELVE